MSTANLTSTISSTTLRARGAKLISVLLATLATVACSTTHPQVGLPEEYLLPYFNWQDPFGPEPGDKVYFDVPRLMARFDLSRAQAVEVQNCYRDAALVEWQRLGLVVDDVDPKAPYRSRGAFDRESCVERLEAAVERVRREGGETKWTPSMGGAAELVVVFDFDETLAYVDRRTGAVALAPSALESIRTARQFASRVVLFTAKPDEDMHAILESTLVEFDGRQVALGTLFDGVFCNNHLIVQTADGSSAASGRHVSVPSKDLRIVDPTLNGVVLVDDNPDRVVQRDLLVEVAPWFGIEAGLVGGLSLPHSTELERAIELIESAHGFALANNCSMADALRAVRHERAARAVER